MKKTGALTIDQLDAMKRSGEKIALPCTITFAPAVE